jgi:hypothetical protein
MLFFSTQNPPAIHYKRQKTAAINWNLSATVFGFILTMR